MIYNITYSDKANFEIREAFQWWRGGQASLFFFESERYSVSNNLSLGTRITWLTTKFGFECHLCLKVGLGVKAGLRLRRFPLELIRKIAANRFAGT